MKGIKKLYQKYKEIILYVIFGAVTTAVSLAAWYVTMKVGVLFLADENGEPTVVLDAIGSTVQWVVGVVVAFITNKKWVFANADKGFRVTMRQFGVFVSSRVLTYITEMGLNIGMIYLFQLLGYRPFEILGFMITERIWAKVITSSATTAFNYILSKLFVFKKRKVKKEKKPKSDIKGEKPSK